MNGPMNNLRAHSAAFATGLALLFGSSALVAPEAAFAQAASQSGVVQRIVIQGNERIEQGTVMSYLPIQPGDTVDAARLDLALKTLARTGPLRRREDRPSGQR